MNLTLETSSGIKVTAPEQKWLLAIIVAIADKDPEMFNNICRLVDNKVEAYATIPESVQKSLTRS